MRVFSLVCRFCVLTESGRRRSFLRLQEYTWYILSDAGNAGAGAGATPVTATVKHTNADLDTDADLLSVSNDGAPERPSDGG